MSGTNINPMAKKKSTSKRRLVKRKAQTGSSNRRYDVMHIALPPGTRVSMSGRTYTETRANRSDRSHKKRI